MTRLLSVSSRGSFSLDLFAPFLYTISDKKGGATMPYVALIGLYFAPILCLLGAGWSYVRWKNEHENEALSERAHKNCKRFLIAAPIAFALFLALKFIFPVE